MANVHYCITPRSTASMSPASLSLHRVSPSLPYGLPWSYQSRVKPQAAPASIHTSRSLQCFASTQRDSEGNDVKGRSNRVADAENLGETKLRRMDTSTGMAIVLGSAGVAGLVPTSPEVTFTDPPPSTTSPRRTQKVKFTCNRENCGKTTVRSINPIALSSGTIFVQCAHCLSQHKLVDNLNIFNDLQGPAAYSQSSDSNVHSRGGKQTFQRDKESISKIGRYYAPIDVMDWPSKDN